jgi:uncharacterized protein
MALPADRSCRENGAVEALRAILASYGSAAVAYSGGADSAFLADVAHEVLGASMVAVLAVSPSLAPVERGDAAGLAHERGWPYAEIETSEMTRGEYRRNDADRCFWCKDSLLGALRPFAHVRGLREILLGTNVDDLGDYRPGLRAAAMHGARAPLVDAGYTKDMVRESSRARGLRTWDKPASPCLSSRIAYGVEVTPERLDRIARAEAFVRSLGFRELRVRDLGGPARIDVPIADVPRISSEPLRSRVDAELAALGFDGVTVDPNGLRSGSMNVALGMPSRRTP